MDGRETGIFHINVMTHQGLEERGAQAKLLLVSSHVHPIHKRRIVEFWQRVHSDPEVLKCNLLESDSYCSSLVLLASHSFEGLATLGYNIKIARDCRFRGELEKSAACVNGNVRCSRNHGHFSVSFLYSVQYSVCSYLDLVLQFFRWEIVGVFIH